LHVRECTYRDAEKTALLTIAQSEKKDGMLCGTCSYEVLRRLFNIFYNIDCKGNGLLNIQFNHEKHKTQFQIFMKDGTISIPFMYNYITGFNAQGMFDWKTFMMRINDATIELYKGTMHCKQASLFFDAMGTCIYLHIPCLINQLFLNYEKDFFGLLSGSLCIEHTQNSQSKCSGLLFLDRAQLKKNIFSHQFMAMTNPRPSEITPLTLDLNIETKKPLHISTSFLQTDAFVALKIEGTTINPHISGSLSLAGGSLAFPFKPLYIMHAKLYWLPDQLDDPVIELVARGTLKKYQVTMRVNGSLKQPHIRFESTPPLTEEQIVTLLLAGSEKGSLILVMPSLIMNNIQQILFGPEQSPSKLERYFKNLLIPLKNIRIVPSFADQSGRGGFKGALEVTINDKLHGIIQKNFGQPEDTKFEVEYLVSDDIVVRGIKDEHGDLGGEVEVRWKF
jgi:hypothetical protein